MSKYKYEGPATVSFGDIVDGICVKLRNVPVMYGLDDGDIAELQDLKRRYYDIFRVADRHARLLTCPGGRKIPDGYMCIHCGVDPTDQPCGSPLPGMTPEGKPIE